MSKCVHWVSVTDDNKSPQCTRKCSCVDRCFTVCTQGWSCECASCHSTYDGSGMPVIHTGNHNTECLDITVVGLNATPCGGWLLVHWAYGSGQRWRHKLGCWKYLLKGSRYGPWKLSRVALKALQQWTDIWAMIETYMTLEQWLKNIYKVQLIHKAS